MKRIIGQFFDLMKRVLWWCMLAAFVGAAGLGYIYREELREIGVTTYENNATTTPERLDPLTEEIETIMNEESFKQRAREEAETIYWERTFKEATEKLEELDAKGFFPDAKKEQALREFFGEHNPALVSFSDEIVKLPRWQEAVAIAAQETQLCTTGVGRQNNCGGIKRPDGTFKAYRTAFEGIEDIAYLLQKPRYVNLSIAEMNGIYCVDEERGSGECPDWTENIETHLAMINKYYVKQF